MDPSFAAWCVCFILHAGSDTGTQLPIRIQHGSLRAPTHATTPVLAIGPGTGVAPLRALVHERIAHGARDHTVVLGCRYLSKDCLFRAEWEALAGGAPLAAALSTPAAGLPCDGKTASSPVETLTASLANTHLAPITLLVAASRDQTAKVYVQDKLRADGAQIWELLGPRRGVAYLCGYV